jgi:NAD(P)H-nitrite reductase large subunit
LVISTLTEQDILDGLKPVCLCKGIRKKTFLKQIRAGNTSLEALQRATGAGTGACGGKRCTPRILELLGRSSAGDPKGR